MYEYKVLRDSSMAAKNSPEEIERVCNDEAANGWRLVSAAGNGAGPSNVFLFFERQRT